MLPLEHFPTLEYERRLWERGYRCIAGLDEAGRGALAGPVIAAAVVVPPGSECTGVWAAVRDSKLLSPPARARLAPQIQAAALAWAVGAAPATEIDVLGIAAATRTAMHRAVDALRLRPDALLIDWVRLEEMPLPQESLIKADRLIVSVAAASILAKVHRDHLLGELDQLHPGYGFARNKGYGVPAHLAALAQSGPCPEHRFSFAPLSGQLSLFAPSHSSDEDEDV